MAYGAGIAHGHAVLDGVAACDGAARNARLTIVAVARIATGIDVGGAGLEAAYAVAASPARHGVEGVKASTMKTASGMKTTAPMETAATTMETAATTMETAANTMETAAATMKTAAASTMEAAAASATACLGHVYARHPQDRACEDPSER